MRVQIRRGLDENPRCHRRPLPPSVCTRLRPRRSVGGRRAEGTLGAGDPGSGSSLSALGSSESASFKLVVRASVLPWDMARLRKQPHTGCTNVRLGYHGGGDAIMARCARRREWNLKCARCYASESTAAIHEAIGISTIALDCSI